jgi:hypothetical protein
MKQANKMGVEKSYIPNDTLVNFIHEWLQIHQKKDAFTTDGKELSEEDKGRIRKSNRMKVYVFDSIIFPAIADLIYFFEALAVSSNLAEAFHDEVTELLDPRFAKESANYGGSRLRMDGIMHFRKNNLARLFISMLSIHNTKIRGGKPTTDFRVGLMYQMLNILGDMMDRLIENQYTFGNRIWKSAYEDYERLMGWFSLLAGLSEDQPNEYDRQIGFRPIWHSNNANLASFHL